MAKKDAKELLKNGWIHILVTFEVVGKPKKHVEESLRKFLDHVKKEERVHWLAEHVEPAVESEVKAENTDDPYFSAFAEVDMLVKNFETMTWLSINFTPASIEIIEPTEFEMPALEIQNWANDMLSNLHNVSARYKQQVSQMEFLRVSLVNLIRNSIVMSVARKPKKLSELIKDTSIREDTLKPQIEALKKEKRLVEKNGVYSIK